MVEKQLQDEVQTPGAVFFIFGATGDLARRKLFPAIYSLYREGKLAEDFAVIGVARRPRSPEEFREDIYESIKEFCRYPAGEPDEWNAFVDHFEYKALDINNVEGFKECVRRRSIWNQSLTRRGIDCSIWHWHLSCLAVSRTVCGTVVCWKVRDGTVW